MSQASSLQSRRALYIGGLDSAVTESTLRAAFLPFGPIQHIDIPMDYAQGTHKGFAFLEFVEAEDANEAVYNMDGAELFGRPLTVNVARADRLKNDNNKAVWATDEYHIKEQEEEEKGKEGKEDSATIQEKPLTAA